MRTFVIWTFILEEGEEFVYERAQIQGGNKKLILPPRPFVVSRADESANDFDVGAEFRSRMVEISVDGSKEQTENVMNPLDVIF